jgi:hypothetical protein
VAEAMWAGLVTNASPYAIPAGAAVEQTNIVTATPGQLTSRGGMRPVSFASAAPEIRDCYPYIFGNAAKMIVLDASGQVRSLATPAYGTALSSPIDPSLSPSSGQVQSSYTGTFHDHAGEPPS